MITFIVNRKFCLQVIPFASKKSLGGLNQILSLLCSRPSDGFASSGEEKPKPRGRREGRARWGGEPRRRPSGQDRSAFPSARSPPGAQGLRPHLLACAQTPPPGFRGPSINCKFPFPFPFYLHTVYISSMLIMFSPIERKLPEEKRFCFLPPVFCGEKIPRIMADTQ